MRSSKRCPASPPPARPFLSASIMPRGRCCYGGLCCNGWAASASSSTSLALLPILRIGGMQFVRMESSDKSDKVKARISEVALRRAAGLCAVHSGSGHRPHRRRHDPAGGGLPRHVVAVHRRLFHLRSVVRAFRRRRPVDLRGRHAGRRSHLHPLCRALEAGQRRHPGGQPDPLVSGDRGRLRLAVDLLELGDARRRGL